jgi:hypothetical protein
MAFGGVGYMRYIAGGSFKMFGLEFANPWVFFIGLAVVLYTMYGWWADTIKEAHEGHHTRVVSLHLRYGMIMFIASEVMFFVAWFWAYFDASLFPGEAIQATRAAFTGGVWPPNGIEVSRSLAPAALQHPHPPALRHDGHLGAPRLAARRPQGPDQRPGSDRLSSACCSPPSRVYEYAHAPFAFAGIRSTAPPSSWRPASMASTSSSARSS